MRSTAWLIGLFFISVLKRGSQRKKHLVHKYEVETLLSEVKAFYLRWKFFIWGENFLSEVIKNRMLTASFHLMVWTSSSCVRCPSFPRPLIFLGRSFWYLQQSHIVTSSGKHKNWYTCNMHVWSSLDRTYVRVLECYHNTIPWTSKYEINSREILRLLVFTRFKSPLEWINGVRMIMDLVFPPSPLLAADIMIWCLLLWSLGNPRLWGRVTKTRL